MLGVVKMKPINQLFLKMSLGQLLISKANSF